MSTLDNGICLRISSGDHLLLDMIIFAQHPLHFFKPNQGILKPIQIILKLNQVILKLDSALLGLQNCRETGTKIGRRSMNLRMYRYASDVIQPSFPLDDIESFVLS